MVTPDSRSTLSWAEEIGGFGALIWFGGMIPRLRLTPLGWEKVACLKVWTQILDILDLG